jgi:glycosyltransferase involved in cell wall biosynthesis
MQIALVVPWLEIGGVETFVFRIARFFQKEGHEVEIVATRCEGAWFHRARQLGIASVCLNEQTSFSRARHAAKVGRYLSRRGFDVCFLNHATEAQAAIAMLPNETIVIPIIHNDDEWVYQVGCSNREAWNVAVAVGPRVFLNTRALVDERPVVEITYGVEIPPCELLNGKDFFSRPLRMIYVGRLLHSQKGILFLPEILRDCHGKGIDVSLCVVGDGPDREAFLDKAALLGVLHLIEMRGVLSSEDVYSEMIHAHVLLMPSFYEGLPIVPLEAMACGCVPIASRLSGITDCVIDDRRTGLLLEVGQIDAFVAAIANIDRNRSMLSSMSNASRSKAEDQFSVDVMGKKYIDLVSLAKGGEFGTAQPRSNLPKLDASLITLNDRLLGKLLSKLTYVKRFLRRVLMTMPHMAQRKNDSS